MVNLPNLDIGNAASSNLTTVVTDYSAPAMDTDRVTDEKETVWQNSEWTKQWGIFNDVPEFKSAMLMKSCWTVGKGYTCDAETQVTLNHITGRGKETFEDIIFNMDLIARIAGDSYAEIMRGKTGRLTNVKALNPGTIREVYDKKGIIKRYEQIVGDNIETFKPEEIFHISHNRLADQIHGISDITSLVTTLAAESENFIDMKKIMRRQARPMIIFKIKTDNTAKINAFIAKMDEAVNQGENIYVPDDENILSYEVVQVNVSQLLVSWRQEIRSKFYRAVGLPQVIFGSATGTESGSKVEYLAHEQVFAKEQRYLEKQIKAQLGLDIKLVAPTTLLENLQADEGKDAQNALTFQPNDVTAGSGQ